MTLRRVRAKNVDQAMKRARKKWKSRVVTKVNWIRDSPKLKGEKLYQVVSHDRKRKK